MSFLLNPFRFATADIWTPLDLGSNLALFYDVSDASTVTLESGLISQLNDKSGNNRHATQTIAASRPGYNATGLNGNGVIITPATASSVFLDNPSSTYPFWFYLGEPAINVSTSLSPIRTSGTNRISIGQGDWLYRDNSSSTSVFLSTLTGVNSYVVYSDATTHYMSRNGDTYLTRARSGALQAFTRVMNSGISSDSNKKMRTVIACTNIPTQTEIDKLVGWAHWTSALESLLPALHPYKSTPPTP